MIQDPFLRVEFSPREREVAELVGDGESYDQIAAALGISSCTVRTHVVRMANKIDIDSERPLPPRHTVTMYIMHERWSRRRAS
jgi:DNA-binding NarL/FixJ family response regulator